MMHRRGFTLIEMMAATALAAIMMVAVISVVSALARHDTVSLADTHDADVRHRLTSVIARDLRHAEYFDSEDNRLTLAGPVSLDPVSLSPTHRPAVVTYEVTEYAGRDWLLRTQVDPESRALDNRWAQLVCDGVRGLSIHHGPTATGLVGPAEAEEGTDASNDSRLDRTLAVPVETVTLTVTYSDAAQPASSTTLMLQ